MDDRTLPGAKPSVPTDPRVKDPDGAGNGRPRPVRRAWRRRRRLRLGPVLLALAALVIAQLPATSPLAAAAASLSAVQPDTGPVGTTLALSGSGFESPGTVAGSVYFTPSGGSPVVVAGSAWTDSSVTVAVPPGLPAGAATVAVYNATSGQMSGALPFTVTSAGLSAGLSTSLSTGDVLAFSPDPLAAPGTLPASGSTSVTLTATGPTGAPLTGVNVYLSISGGAAGQATVGGQLLNTTPTAFTTNASGQLAIIYSTPATLHAGAVDTITAASDATGAPAVQATDAYEYGSAPTVSGVSPTSGPASGGTSVTISGSGFTGGSAVDFGGIAAPSYAVVSNGEITATSPPGSGTVDVTVTTAEGTSATGAADQFTYAAAAPAVSGISPASGPASGGTSVTISGSGFTAASAVNFGGVAALGYTVVSDGEVTATSPPGSGTVDVTVTTAEGTSATGAADQFTYVAASVTAPAVSGVSPASGPASGGTSVTISGSGFTAASAVDFGGIAALSYTVVSDGEVTAMSPPGSGTVDVTVTTAGGTSAIGGADQFTYVAAAATTPAVLVVSPASGPASGGTSVTISGSGFTGASAVDFGGIPALSYTVVSDGEITATAPPGSGTVDVTVTTASGTGATNAADRFTYVAAAPTFSDVPASFWASAPIARLAAAGVVSGFPDGTFRPNDPVTRAEFVKMLVVVLGLPAATKPAPFKDVPAGAWYAHDVAAAVQAGIVDGVSATSFAPDATLTREQLAVILARALRLPASKGHSFKDEGQIDSWAASSVSAVVAAGYMNGFPDGTFQPRGTTTRAQAATVLAAVLSHHRSTVSG